MVLCRASASSARKPLYRVPLGARYDPQLLGAGGVRHPPLHRPPSAPDLLGQPAADVQRSEAMPVERQADVARFLHRLGERRMGRDETG